MAVYSDGPGFFGRIKGIFGIGGGDADRDRRAAKRVDLRIPMHVQRGDVKCQQAFTRNLSPIGLFVECERITGPGTQLTLTFEAAEPGEPDIVIQATVARTDLKPPKGMGLSIDRAGTGPEAWKAFRNLIFHYRNAPSGVVAQRQQGFTQARCEACDWLGRVSTKSPRCPKCGKAIELKQP